MNLHQLYYFQVIASHLSYTKAAEELNVAQPSLWRSMSSLEQELGVQLFYKQGRNIQLTPYGIKFLEYVEHILQELGDARREVQRMLCPDAGIIRLAFVDTLSTHFIPRLVKEYYQENTNSKIKFEFYQQPTMTMVESLKKGAADLGFGAYTNDTLLSCHLVFDEELLVAVSKEHPLASKDIVELSELAEENIIAYNNNGRTRCFIDALFEKNNITPKVVSEVDSNTMMASIVSTNLGVALMAKMYGTHLYNVKLLKIANAKIVRPLYLFWVEAEQLLPAVKKFRDFVVRKVDDWEEQADF